MNLIVRVLLLSSIRCIVSTDKLVYTMYCVDSSIRCTVSTRLYDVLCRLVYTMYGVDSSIRCTVSTRLYDVLCRLVYMLYCVDWQANYANYRASEGWCATTLLRCLTISTNNVQVWCCFYQISDGTSVLWGILHYYSITCGSSLSSESLRV